MSRYFLYATFLILFSQLPGTAIGQGMAFNATGTIADASAMLDVSSTNKGMLVPRMTTAQRNGISLPAKGLLVYDSTLASFYYNSGTPSSPLWTALGGGSGSLPTGAAGEILYHNGSNWVATGPGTNGQFLVLSFGVPTWVTLPYYSLVATSSANGTISPSGITIASTGASQTYTITPASGYYINNVTVDGTSVGFVTTYTFTSVSANHTINASFSGPDTIVASAGANGTISSPGTTLVIPGSSKTYTITPGTGYHINNVTVDGTNVGAVSTYTFSSVNANHTISAAFSINLDTIVATAGAHGTISPSGSTVYPYGSSQTYTITPASGYYPSAVIVDGTNVGPVSSYTFGSIVTNHTISATFAAPDTIVASAGANGTISPAGSTLVAPGGSQTFTITPSSGYYTSSVIVDGTNIGPASTYTFGSVSANHTISATFSGPDTIIATSGANGTISPSGSTLVIPGASQTYTITPASGYYSSSVIVDGINIGPASTYTFGSVFTNHTISANFSLLYTIVASSGANGTIIPLGSTIVAPGGSQTYTITPSPGYNSVSTIIDGTDIGPAANYTFGSVLANHTIVANFGHTTNIVSSTGANGTISPLGTSYVTLGTSQTYTITPSAGYHISAITVDGIPVGTSSSTFNFSSIAASHTISVAFSNTVLAVGDSYQGGIIAYLLAPGDIGYDSAVQHGIIAATSDQSTGIRWNNGTPVTTGASGSLVGDGLTNTNINISVMGPGIYASTICRSYTGGGYTDWFLPSINELQILYSVGISSVIGGFNFGAYYYSSTEAPLMFGTILPWAVFFNTGSVLTIPSGTSCYVRATRYF